VTDQSTNNETLTSEGESPAEFLERHNINIGQALSNKAAQESLHNQLDAMAADMLSRLDNYGKDSHKGLQSAKDYRQAIDPQSCPVESLQSANDIVSQLEEAIELAADDTAALAIIANRLAKLSQTIDGLIEFNLDNEEMATAEEEMHSRSLLRKEYGIIHTAKVWACKFSNKPFDKKLYPNRPSNYTDDLSRQGMRSRFYAVKWEIDTHELPTNPTYLQVAKCFNRPTFINDKYQTIQDFMEWIESTYNFNFDRLIKHQVGDTITLVPVIKSNLYELPTITLTVLRNK
jgi:hypothetical protein